MAAARSRPLWSHASIDQYAAYLHMVAIAQEKVATSDEQVVANETKSKPFSSEDLPESVETYKAFNSTVRFIFTIGLEGTGHHTIDALVRESPSEKALDEWHMYGRNMPMNELMKSLANNPNSAKRGFLDLHCAPPGTTTAYNPGKKPIVVEEMVGSTPNAEEYKQGLVRNLRKVDALVAAKTKQSNHSFNFSSNEQLPIGLNAPDKGWQNGMYSYPTFRGNICTKNNYPNLDLFYDACNEAKVDCHHIYIHRSPYAILQSTTINRKFNPRLLEAIHLYTSMLHVIHYQLQSHGRRGLGCFGILDDRSAVSSLGNETDNSWDNLWVPFSQVWGWKTPDDFKPIWNKKYRVPKKMTPEQKQALVPPKLESYMKSFDKLSRDALNVCQQQYASVQRHA